VALVAAIRLEEALAIRGIPCCRRLRFRNGRKEQYCCRSETEHGEFRHVVTRTLIVAERQFINAVA
jgi:hypothetical protein